MVAFVRIGQQKQPFVWKKRRQHDWMRDGKSETFMQRAHSLPDIYKYLPNSVEERFIALGYHKCDIAVIEESRPLQSERKLTEGGDFSSFH